MTKDDLHLIMPLASANRINTFFDSLVLAMEKYEINTPLRQSAFLAQIAVESGSLTYTHELWGPTSQQLLYERDFTQPWQAGLKKTDRNYLAYNLGNSEVGDGRRFRGHGLIQDTGRINHGIISKALGVDFVAHPELLEGPVYACESAGHFWLSNGINIFADIPDFDGCCDKVNIGKKTQKVGDANDYAKRLEFYLNAKKVFNI